MKNIGKPCAGKPHARFDEGRLMDDQSRGHAVAACGEASMKVPAVDQISASYSTRNYVKRSCHDYKVLPMSQVYTAAAGGKHFFDFQNGFRVILLPN
jgi:hypothetical protein